MANIFKNPIGIDISDFKIRLFQVEQKRKNNYKLSAYTEIAVPDGFISDGEIKNRDEVIKLITTCYTKPVFGKFTTRYVNASISEKKAFLKNISIPNVPPNELLGAIRWGIEQNIPVTLDQSYFDWSILGPSPKDINKLQAIVVVASRQIVDSYTEVIEQAGLQVLSFENESAAIARCLISKENESLPIVIIDLGKSRTTIIIHYQNVVQYSNTIDINGKDMTTLISQYLHLNYTDAEKAKIICGLDKTKAKGSIRKILLPIIESLMLKIQENIDYFNNYLSADTNQVNKIILTGSVAMMQGLASYAHESLRMPIELSQPWVNINLEHRQKNIVSNDKGFYSYTTAIGLALKKNQITSYA
ncbi:MAG: type IV pilus assembly protein PilM [Patescibacteria group bacterium]